MSENLKLAIERLQQNTELMEEVKQNPPKNVDDVIALAARLGVSLTKADILSQGDLTLEELEQAAGGSKFSDNTQYCEFEGGFFCTFMLGAAFWDPRRGK